MDLDTIKNLCQAESMIGATTLVTLYVESGKALWLVREHIASEIKTSANIKNKQVGKSVGSALRMILHKLKILNTIPSNGMVLCAGDFHLKTDAKPGSYV